MSVEEFGWSVRDNHCDTLKQYIMSSFTPKGRIGCRNFFITAVVIMYFYAAAAYAPCYLMFGDYENWFYEEIVRVAVMDHAALFYFPEAVLGGFELAVEVFRVFTTSDATKQTLMIYLVAIVIFFDYLIFCCCMRRLHDTGSVNDLAFWLIPIIGVFILAFFLLFAVDKGTNEYGSDPRKPYEGQYL